MKIILNFILLFLCPLSFANEVIVLGEKVSFYSKILKEERELLVAVPTSYANSPGRHYPVLYTLDGESHFRHVAGTVHWLTHSGDPMPETIVVALPNTDRARDVNALSFTGNDGLTVGGGAKAFIKFIKEEVIPYVNKQYRTQPYRTLVGHSAAGRFTLDFLISEPTVFNAYIAMSPWVARPGTVKDLIDRANQYNKFDQWSNRFLFLSIGNEPDLKTEYNKIVDYFKSKSPHSLELYSEEFLQDGHMSVATQTLHNALQALFSSLLISPELLQKDAAAVKQHHQKIALQYDGLQISSEQWINVLGYEQLNQGKIQQALETFTLNTKDYPESGNAFDSLADAYVAKGELKKAVGLLKKAVALGEKYSDPRLGSFRSRLKEFSNRLK